MLHSHLPYVLNHGRWPHGSDWLCEAAIETYLPILQRLEALEAANVAAPVTVGFTPVLGNMLAHATFARELDAYFEQRFEHCAQVRAELRDTPEASLIPLVEFWHDRLTSLYRFWHGIGGDLVGRYRRLQDRERLELTSSSATHALLPLLGRDESIQLQLALGRAEHRRLFGRDPEGCWVPECAYRGAGHWEPLPQAPGAGRRPGIETHLARAGYRYFFIDAHMAWGAQGMSVYDALFGTGGRGLMDVDGSPYRAYAVAAEEGDVAALVRDPRTSQRVWDRHGGYPGDGAYLEFHKLRWPGGLRLWRVTSPGTDLGAKLPYVPRHARLRARTHARHFASELAAIHDTTNGAGEGRVIVAPFDTELFGHWWFEGPEFMADLYAELPSVRGVRPVTAGQHLDSWGAHTALQPAQGSWGRDGNFSMWMNDDAAVVWPAVWELERRFWDTAAQAESTEAVYPIVEQAARELLLAQSSDWPFIVSAGAVADYATSRFNGHASDCHTLLDHVERVLAGGDIDAAMHDTHRWHTRDDLFPRVMPEIKAALRRTA